MSHPHPAPSPSGWIEIGRIVAPQGVRGEVRVYPDSDFPERFLTPGERWLRRKPNLEPEVVTLASGRFLPGKGLYVIHLAGVTNREQAEALRDAVLLVKVGDRLPLEPDEFHVGDLLGLEVRLHQDNTRLGTVVDVFAAGNDLLAVALDPAVVETGSPPPSAQQKPILIPLVPEIVPVVDVAGGYVAIAPPPGLLDL
ncbi:MAG: ribosome maturation factor RimM [Cyanobacteria bacterium]|nr:ribosome maturation factor RimM [Cyanobacteriota bacterium]MDA0865790.1 ribosome maturation factor RimM [Cyanobacteriota bacterium]